jgi:hypothetical protein
MKVCLALHDFSVVNNRLLWLETLKKQFPDFKVSLFTVPMDEKKDWGPSLIRADFLEEIKRNLDWIQIIPHGFYHTSTEMLNVEYDEFVGVLRNIESAFNTDGLPFEKGFCAPHFRWGDDVVRVLDDMGWWGAVHRNKDMPTPQRFYKYNFMIDEPFWESKGDLRLHGHIYGTNTDLGECFSNLLKLPDDVEWVYASECLEEREAL